MMPQDVDALDDERDLGGPRVDPGRQSSFGGYAAFYADIRRLADTYAPRPVRRVAVVGNQPLPPSEARVQVIESADLVFRVNGFRCDEPGGQPAVGSTTHVVVFNRGVRPTPWFFQDYADRLYLMIEPGMLFDENPKTPQFWPRDLGSITVPNRAVILPLGDALGVDTRSEARWATTGMVMLWMSLHLYPGAVIDATGFSFVDTPVQSSWNHAYGDPSAVGMEHEIHHESRLIRSWIDEGRITFHR